MGALPLPVTVTAKLAFILPAALGGDRLCPHCTAKEPETQKVKCLALLPSESPAPCPGLRAPQCCAPSLDCLLTRCAVMQPVWSPEWGPGRKGRRRGPLSFGTGDCLAVSRCSHTTESDDVSFDADLHVFKPKC